MEKAMTERAAEPGRRPRMAFVDNIRWTVIAMVVLIHACVTYSGLGSWYYVEESSLGIAERLVFYVYQIFSQAFFMGLLFFVAAVFIPGAYDRKGFRRFLTDRLVRLGAPTLIYMLLLHPLTVFVREAGLGSAPAPAEILRWYGGYVTSGEFVGSSGPLWFALALLVFSFAYALIRLGSGRFQGAKPPLEPSARAVHGAAAALIALMTAASFLVRLVQPLGTSWLNMQLCFFPQYVILFAAGLWAGRRGLLPALPRKAGMAWLRLSLAVGIPAWFLLIGLGGAFNGREALFGGGWHWQAIGYAAWEAFFCVAVGIGLITLYREKADARTPVTGLLSDTCFGIYVFHAPLLVGVSMLLRGAPLPPLAKAALAGAAAWAASLAVAWIVRRIPGLRRLFA